MTTALYARTATGYTTDQIAELEAYCQDKGWTVSRIYSDAGVSGLTTDRHALKEMMQDVRCGKISRVIVSGHDRLSRRPQDAVEIIVTLIENNVELITV